MSAKSVAACLGLAALALLVRPLHAKAPLPTVMLYPASPTDVAATVDLRTRLRLDAQVQVLTYDPESAAVRRAAEESAHPEWMAGSLTNEGARYSLARALGASFYIVVGPGRQPDSTHLELVDTTPAALAFDWYGTNRQYGARALESQIQAALAHPAAAAIESIAAAPVAPTPLPAAPPVQIATAPPPVVTPPVVTPPAPAPVVVPEGPPVPAAPLPLLATGRPETAAPVGPSQTIITPERVVARALPLPAPTALLPKPAVVPTAPAPVAAATLPALPLKLPEQVVPRPVPPAPPTQMARMLPPALPAPELAPATEPPAGPIPDDTPPVAAAPVPTLKVPAAKAPDITSIEPLLAQGDAAMDGGDFVSAISFYRQAINGVPLSVVPRLKLAQAYQKSGLNDKALDEAKRAVEISPDDDSLQKFLTQMDQDSGTSDGSLARAHALVERDPANAGAHSDLAEALWNSGDLRGAETEYNAARKLSLAGDHSADAHLAQLYAAQGRYDDSLTALKAAGGEGYLLALKIVRSRSETVSSTIDASRSAFAKGSITREQFYDTAKKTSADAQALADFVSQLKPLPAYKLSHLHRVLSANLLAQEAATLVSMIETGSDATAATVSDLDKSAMTEMLTARAAEEKLGLWARPVQDGKR